MLTKEKKTLDRYRKNLQSVPQNNIILIGLIGGGKTSVGYVLAKKMGLGFFDLDEWIEKGSELSISKLWKKEGEQAYRQKESLYLQNIRHIKNHVISLGGGSSIDDKNWALIKNMGITIWLNTPPEMIAFRLCKNKNELSKRPFFELIAKEPDQQIRTTLVENVLKDLFLKRQHRYAEADLVINDEYSSPEVVANCIRNLIALNFTKREDDKKEREPPSPRPNP